MVPEDHSDESSPFNFYPHESGTSRLALETTNRCQIWPGSSGSHSWLAFPKPVTSLQAGCHGGCRPARLGWCVRVAGGRAEALSESGLAYLLPYVSLVMYVRHIIYMCTVSCILTFLPEDSCLYNESHWPRKEGTDTIQNAKKPSKYETYNSHKACTLLRVKINPTCPKQF